LSKQKSNRRQWIIVILFLIIIAILIFTIYYEPSLESTSGHITLTPDPVVVLPNQITETSPVDDWYEVYFTSPRIPFDGVETGGIEIHLIEKIDSAKTSIDLAVYEFDLENVARALISAHKRGVEVRVVYDDEFSDPDPQMKELRRAGINTVPDERSAFMHNKFFIFDNACIWTGSFNISVNAAYRNNENAFYFCSDKAAQNYTTEFEELYNSQFGATSPATTPFTSFTVEGIAFQNYFAPEDDVMEKVIKEVVNADDSIHFMAFSFTGNKLGEAMIDVMGEGVEISGIFESRGANTEYSECQTLLENGADVMLDGNPRTFHHKVIIIDGEIVIFGSFNFSDSADKENDENLIIVYDAHLAQEFEQEFLRQKVLADQPLNNTCKSR